MANLTIAYEKFSKIVI